MEEGFVSWGFDTSCQLRIDGDWNLKKFDGKKELGDDVLSQLRDLEFLIFRDGEKKRKHDELNKKDN